MQPQLAVDVLVTPEDRRHAMHRDVREGLTAVDKYLAPVWFYDEKGSRLFEEITKLPEYYPTRTERAILAERAGEIVAAAGADTLVEIGSGTSEKTRLLLDAMAASGSLGRIVLFDISKEVLAEAAETLGRHYGVEVQAVVGDFRKDVAAAPEGGRRLWAFLGSTIGNLDPSERRELFDRFAGAMAPGDHLLLGTDLVKDPVRLVAAYDDAAGVTAEFNRNVLAVLNRELRASFDLELFEHRALWNPRERWIEMRLRARQAHEVRIEELDLTVRFEQGEEIRTEISAKFTSDQVAGELRAARLVETDAWQDRAGDFRLAMAGLVDPPAQPAAG